MAILNAPKLEDWNSILARIQAEIDGFPMPAAPAPKAPTPGSHCDVLLRAMQDGRTLTPLVALDHYNCLSLSQRCGELQRLGWPIKRGWLELPSGKRVRTYAL